MEATCHDKSEVGGLAACPNTEKESGTIEVVAESDRPDKVALPADSNNNCNNTFHTMKTNVETTETRPKVYHTGWRLNVLTAGLQLSAPLVSIVSALDGFDRSGWVVTSYFLTYTGFLIIYAKLSDILGCKLMLLVAITIFTVFSIACGLSNSMLLLIVFRAFQGIGGSGIYAFSTIMVPLMVPPEKYATYIAVVTSVFAFSSVLGPILGGAITDNSTWRWVFFFNGPGGALAAMLIYFAIPFGFPFGESTRFFHSMISMRTWKRIDIFGAFVSLAASILLVFALQQGGVIYPWGGGAIVSVFVMSAVGWIVFVLWERHLSCRNTACEPIFPWRLAHNRFFLGLLLNGFLTGFPFMAAIINIPQRLQTVNATTAIGAGLRLLPLLLLSPVASASAGFLVSKLRIPPLFLLIVGACLQTIGVGLFSSIDSQSLEIPNDQYGYQVIMGFGFGFSLSVILMMAPLVVQQNDMALAIGSVTQIRVLGGTIGLAICSALLNNHIQADASKFLSVQQVAALLESFSAINQLPLELQLEVRRVYATGYSQQMRVMLYFCIVCLLSLALLVEKKQRKFTPPPNGMGKAGKGGSGLGGVQRSGYIIQVSYLSDYPMKIFTP
ncbi:MFS general substrate transporter [Decorospora gaudefroyi]|uniref:MFS general substrate transporter n=1 Tax=Decorospora gaudefroyi TaxID=184978 RepID=A0A6A5JWE9_9PLEO|nr:MFS general substrate transporter [Decorospora gaudefroyi]